MHHHHPTVVSTRDYYRLQAMMCTMIDLHTPMASLARHKLRSAVVMLPTDISPDVVAAGRCVHLTIDGYRSDVRALTWGSPVRGTIRELSLLVPRGLALLGLAVGQSISYTSPTGRTEFKIEAVSSDNDAVLQFDPVRNAHVVLAGAAHGAATLI
jgi:hypothetical protein